VEIRQELVNQLQRGNVVLFVGAGLSIGAGMPGWAELISPLAARIGYEGDNLLKAAQYYENRKGRHALISHLQKQFNILEIEPTENHNLIVQLPVKIVFTTNFDNLLERAYRKAGKTIQLVVGQSSLPYWDESKVNLVKLHGTFDRPASIIITEHDFNTIYGSNSLIMQHLGALLATKMFLFIGYSFNDPDLNQIYDQLSSKLKKHQSRPHIVTFNVEDFMAEDLSRRGFHVIRLQDQGDRNVQLTNWLKKLLDAVFERTSETDKNAG